MIDAPFTYRVEVYRDGVLLECAVASLGACFEDALWHGVLAGRFANDGSVPRLSAFPVWASSGPPAVKGFRLEAAGEVAGQYDLNAFAAQVQSVIRTLVSSKVLADKAQVEWRVVAVKEAAGDKPRFRSRLSRAPYPLRAGVLPEARSGELSVMFEPGVLDTIRQATVAAYPCEVAGLLVGELVFDPERRAVELTVRDQLPITAGAGGSSAGHFSFGPESFLSARRAAGELGSGAPCGWWHTHPPCKDCVSKPDCLADMVFFSADDHQVQASAFPATYAVALVAGKVRDQPAGDPGFRLYGWKRGSMVERELRIRGTAGGQRGESLAPMQREREVST
jgi:proteasome lid subunit RPN8/RPN11